MYSLTVSETLEHLHAIVEEAHELAAAR